MKKSEFRNLIREEIKRTLKENYIKKVGDVVDYGDDECTVVAMFPNLSAAKKAIKIKYPRTFEYYFDYMDDSVEYSMVEPSEPWYELKPKDPKAFDIGPDGRHYPTVVVSGEDIA
jgi:hypothetical protein